MNATSNNCKQKDEVNKRLKSMVKTNNLSYQAVVKLDE